MRLLMNYMRLLLISCFLTAVSGCAQLTPHPRIYLDAATLANARAKYRANDRDWQAIRAEADSFVNAAIYTVTPVAATNSIELEMTVAEAIPFGFTAKRSNGTLVSIVVASNVATVNFSVPQSLAANVNNILHIRGASTPPLNGNYQVRSGSGSAWRVNVPGVPDGTYNESTLTVAYGSEACSFSTTADNAWGSLNTAGTSVGYFIHRSGDNTIVVHAVDPTSGGITGRALDSTTWGPFNGAWQTLLTAKAPGGYIYYQYQAAGWYKALRSLSIAYVVTGNTAYANKAVAMLDYINGFYKKGKSIAPVLPDKGYPTRYACYSLALAYDWLHPLLSSTQKTDTANTVNAWFDWYRNGTVVNGSKLYQPTMQPSGNYWGGHILGFGLLGLATHGDNPRAQEIVDYVRGDFNTSMTTAFSPAQQGDTYGSPRGVFAGGQLVQGYNYAPNHITRLLQYMVAIRTATGEDIFSTTNWAQLFAKNLFYNLKPNNWEATREGDYPTTFFGVMPKTMPTLLSYVLDGTAEGGWMQFMLNRMDGVPAAGKANQALDILDQFLFYSPSRAAVDYTATEPTYFHSQGDEHIYWRSDWSSNAVWSSFRAGQQWSSDHEMLSMGTIDITRGGDNLFPNVQAWAGANGYSGPGPSSSAVWNSNSNSLQFSDGTGIYTPYGPSGGATYWGIYSKPAFKISSSFAYASTDLTTVYMGWSGAGPYAARTLRYYYRSYAALGDGTFVVFDRARANAAGYPSFAIRWHMNGVGGAPVNVGGNTWKVTVGSSAGYLIPVLPAAANVTMANNLYGTSYANQAYHVDIANSTPGTELNVMTVLYATSADGSAPPITALGTAGTVIDPNFAGVQINDTMPKVFIHAAAVQDDGDNRYSARTFGRTTFSTNHERTATYFIGGLAPGAYDVLLNGQRTLQAQAVGQDGTLSFVSTSGAFTITGAYAVNADPSPLPPAVVGKPYAGATFAATDGSAPYTYSATGLPAGLTLNAVSGVLSGTALAPSAVTIAVQATDSAGEKTTAEFDFVVKLPELTITGENPPETAVGATYSHQMRAAGGDGNYAWWVVSGDLPPGLRLSPQGLIEGSSTKAGVFVVSLGVSSGDGQIASSPLRLVVASSPPSTRFAGGNISGVVIR